MAVITDNFNRVNGAIGSSSEGWSWTVTAGAFNITSNAATPGTGGHNNARADSDLNADHYAQAVCTCAGGVDDVGVIVRYASAADSGYVLVNDNTNDVIYKNSAGSYTSLASSAQAGPSGAVMRLEASGTSLTGKRGASTTASTTDSTFTTNTRAGIRAYNEGGTTSTVDDFEAGDLTAAGARPRLIGGRLVNRGLTLGGLVS